MQDLETRLAQLHDDLGWKRLSPIWAKVEILLGLLAVGMGMALLSGGRALAWLGLEGEMYLPAGLLLFVLGGYLALAGHRSHLYQSNTRLTAYVTAKASEIQSKG